MKSLDDKALALALQSGDEAAFDEIVTRFQGRVYAVAYRVTGNREDALDIAQEVFIKVYRKIDTWKPTGGFLPWVLRMTTNHSIDQLRRKRRYPEQALEEAFVPTTEGASVEPVSMRTSTEVQGREIEERIIDLLEIEAIRKKVVGTLPYGFQKRVELARALAMQPEVLLLDEPMAGMNLEETEDMARFILNVNQMWGVSIILVEHDMGVVMDISKRVCVLEFGQKIAEGSPREIQGNPQVVRAYLGEDEKAYSRL